MAVNGHASAVWWGRTQDSRYLVTHLQRLCEVYVSRFSACKVVSCLQAALWIGEEHMHPQGNAMCESRKTLIAAIARACSDGAGQMFPNNVLVVTFDGSSESRHRNRQIYSKLSLDPAGRYPIRESHRARGLRPKLTMGRCSRQCSAPWGK